MATIVDERAPFRGGRIVAVTLAVLAAMIVLGLGIWRSQPAAEPAPSVEQAEVFSPEAVRVSNTSGLYQGEAFSPEAVRITNTRGLFQTEAFSPELMRITNLSDSNRGEAFSPELVRMRNTESFVLGAR